MTCPNCGTDIRQNTTVCNNCGTDIKLAAHAHRASNALYNKGLALAQNRDMSGAAEALNKSVGFNKKNINSRNLLGLVYFEIGQIGLALKHWIISSAYNNDHSNLAFNYIKAVQNSGRAWEKLNDTLKMYNNSLDNLKRRSDDLAVIQLKKAIDTNPKFIDAYNLLTFCYLELGENDRALSLVEKVLHMDVNNTVALHYYLMLKPGGHRIRPIGFQTQQPKVDAVQRQEYTRSVRISEKKKRRVFPIAEILYIIVGALCAAAIFFTQIYPDAIQKKDDEISLVKSEAVAVSEAHASEIAELESKLASVQTENSQLQRVNDEMKEAQVLQERIQRIYDVSILSQGGNHEEAAGILYTMDITGLPGDAIESYETLKQSIYPIVASDCYSAGYSDYQSANYSESKAKLEKCLQYANEENFVDDAMYYLGRIAEIETNKDVAKAYYEQLMEKFPKSNLFNNARQRNNNL